MEYHSNILKCFKKSFAQLSNFIVIGSFFRDVCLLTLSNTGFFRLSLHGGDGKWSRPLTLELFNRLKLNLVH